MTTFLVGTQILKRIDLEPARLNQFSSAELDHYIAIVNWLTDYQPGLEAPYREQVEGYLQAIDHLCAVKAWEKAKAIVSMPLEVFEHRELHELLGMWGCFQELIQVCEKLLGEVDPATEVAYRQSLGNIYYLQSKYAQASECYQRGLDLASALADTHKQAQLLDCLGNVCRMMGQSTEAIDFYQRSSTIAKGIGDRTLESQPRMNLALLHIYLGQYREAYDCYRQELRSARKESNMEFESIALSSLALLYICTGEYKKAIQYSKQSLAISRKISSRFQEGWGVCNLGKALLRLNRYLEAEQHLRLALNIFRELECRRAESEVLETLSELYRKMNLADLASDLYEQALAICQKLGVPLINPTSETLATQRNGRADKEIPVTALTEQEQ